MYYTKVGRDRGLTQAFFAAFDEVGQSPVTLIAEIGLRVEPASPIELTTARTGAPQA